MASPAAGESGAAPAAETPASAPAAWQLRRRVAAHAQAAGDRPAYVTVDPDGGPDTVLDYAGLDARTAAIESALRAADVAGAVVLAHGLPAPWLAPTLLACLSHGVTILPCHGASVADEVRRAADAIGADLVISPLGPGSAGDHPVVTDEGWIEDPAAALVRMRRPGAPDRMAGRDDTDPGARADAPDGAPVGAAGDMPVDMPGGPPDGPPVDAPDDAPAAETAAVARLLLQTSGTTGVVRFARRPAPTLDHAARAIVDGVGMGPGDRVLSIVSLCHSYGIEHGFLAPMDAGATVVAIDGLDLPAIARALESPITHLPGVPAMYERLADRPEVPLGSVGCLYAAGAPLPPAVAERLRSVHGVTVGQLYGATEVGSVTYDPAGHPDFAAGSVGRPFAGVSVRIRPTPDAPGDHPGEGEVLIAAPSMYEGYIGHPATIDDGHQCTGDLGYVDEAGRLWITGRLRTLIDVGGAKVHPGEVEDVLRRHPRVSDAVVVPLQQTDCVQRLKAYVTLRAGVDGGAGAAAADATNAADDTSTAHDVRQFAREHLAPHKVPRMVEVRDAFPRTASGKVLRHQL